MKSLKVLRLRRDVLKETADEAEFRVTEARHLLRKARNVINWCMEMELPPTNENNNDVTNARQVVRDLEGTERQARNELRKAEVELEVAQKKNDQEEKLVKLIADSDIVVNEGNGYFRVKHQEQRGYVEFETIRPANGLQGTRSMTIRIGNPDNLRDTIATLQTIVDKMESEK